MTSDPPVNHSCQSRRCRSSTAADIRPRLQLSVFRQQRSSALLLVLRPWLVSMPLIVYHTGSSAVTNSKRPSGPHADLSWTCHIGRSVNIRLERTTDPENVECCSLIEGYDLKQLVQGGSHNAVTTATASADHPSTQPSPAVSHDIHSTIHSFIHWTHHAQWKAYRIQQTRMIQNVTTHVYITHAQRSYYRTV